MFSRLHFFFQLNYDFFGRHFVVDDKGFVLPQQQECSNFWDYDLLSVYFSGPRLDRLFGDLMNNGLPICNT